jgi:hypothetical protein
MLSQRHTRKIVATALTASAIALTLVSNADARQRSAANSGRPSIHEQRQSAASSTQTPRFREARQQAASAANMPRIREARQTAVSVQNLPQIFESRQRARSAGTPWIKEQRQSPASRGGANISEQSGVLHLVQRLVKNIGLRISGWGGDLEGFTRP